MAHLGSLAKPVNAAVITVSDTRTPATDHSGQLIQSLLQQAEHTVVNYCIVPDDPNQIRVLCQTLSHQPNLEAIILTGGTGIAPRDTTYEAVSTLLDKTLPGFGELFRQLSFQEIGSRALASRAVAGVYGSTLIFSLPGSSKAVRLAMEALILPELSHLVSLLQT